MYLVYLSWWRHQMETFPRYWPFVRGIHRSPVNFPPKGQWRGALMLSLICTWTNGWVNNRNAGDLRRNCTHYDVLVMSPFQLSHTGSIFPAFWKLIICNCSPHCCVEVLCNMCEWSLSPDVVQQIKCRAPLNKYSFLWHGLIFLKCSRPYMYRIINIVIDAIVAQRCAVCNIPNVYLTTHKYTMSIC